MKLLLFFSSFFYYSIISIYGQDILYTVAGKKIPSKVLEINSNEIKYKDFTNIDGPTYVIYNSDVVLIQFTNGSTQIINSNANSFSPIKTETIVTKKIEENKKPNLYYMNPNLLSINALALANGDIHLMFDRDFYNGKLSLSILGGYNFNSRMGVFNYFIADSKDHTKKLYDAGLGINYMPSNTKRGQYFVGLMAKYMAFTFDNVTDTTNNQLAYTKSNGYQMAIMISNGWVIRVTPNFNFKIFASIGAPINSIDLKSKYSNFPKLYIGYCFGYRF